MPSSPVLYLRCKKCKLSLAGPLSLSQEFYIGQPETALLPALGYAEIQDCPDLHGVTNNLEHLPHQHKDSDILTHPQWWKSWKYEWEKLLDETKQLAPWPHSISAEFANYGCCGPVGKIHCQCQSALGNIFADCYSSQWLCFDAFAIERSDQTDGAWDYFDFDSSGSSEKHYLRKKGHFQNGRAEGEWEVWRYKTLQTESQQNPELIRLEYWQEGQCIDFVNAL